MFNRLAILVAAIVAATACGRSDAQPAAPAAPSVVPRGATIGAGGYATILDAPPAPFVPAAPGEPGVLTPDQLAGHARFQRAAKFQNKVGGEVIALAKKLRVAEKGNFVDLYYEKATRTSSSASCATASGRSPNIPRIRAFSPPKCAIRRPSCAARSTI